MLNSTKITIFLFFASLVLFTCGLSHHELTQFETRFGYFAQEIGQYGLSFFPMLYGKPYPDYPATYPILIYVASLISGKVTLFSAVWPSAINAAGTVAMTYRLGALHKPCWGWAAVLFELATFYFLMTARSLSLDQFVVFATTLSFYVVYVSRLQARPALRKWLPAIFLYGFVFRGPMGILVPLAVVFVVDGLSEDYKGALKTLVMGTILLVLSTVLLLFLAFKTGGEDFVWQVIGMQGISRISQLGHYPVYYYFQEAFTQYALTFPCAVIVVLALCSKIFARKATGEMKFLQYLVGWTAVLLIGLSVPSGKKLRYILPIVPAISLISARMVLDNSSWVLAQCRSLLLGCCFIFPVVGLLLLVGLEGFSLTKKMELGAHIFSAGVGLVLVFAVGYYSLKLWSEKTTRYVIKLAMGVGAWLVLVVFIIQPIHAYFNRTQPFAEQVAHFQLPGQALLFYNIGPDAEDVKLLVALTPTLMPVFVTGEPQLLLRAPVGLVVVRDSRYQQFSLAVKEHLPVLYRGKIGHQTFVLISNRR